MSQSQGPVNAAAAENLPPMNQSKGVADVDDQTIESIKLESTANVLFNHLDTNHDGVVDREEFNRGVTDGLILTQPQATPRGDETSLLPDTPAAQQRLKKHSGAVDEVCEPSINELDTVAPWACDDVAQACNPLFGRPSPRHLPLTPRADREAAEELAKSAVAEAFLRAEAEKTQKETRIRMEAEAAAARMEAEAALRKKAADIAHEAAARLEAEEQAAVKAASARASAEAALRKKAEELHSASRSNSLRRSRSRSNSQEVNLEGAANQSAAAKEAAEVAEAKSAIKAAAKEVAAAKAADAAAAKEAAEAAAVKAAAKEEEEAFVRATAEASFRQAAEEMAKMEAAEQTAKEQAKQARAAQVDVLQQKADEMSALEAQAQIALKEVCMLRLECSGNGELNSGQSSLGMLAPHTCKSGMSVVCPGTTHLKSGMSVV